MDICQLEKLCIPSCQLTDINETCLIVYEAKQVCRYYDAQSFTYEELKSKFQSTWEKFDASMAHLQEGSCDDRNTIDIVNTSRSRISKCYAEVCHCLDSLGLICATEAIKICVENVALPFEVEDSEVSRDCLVLYGSFLDEALCEFLQYLPCDYELLLNTESGLLKAVKSGFISSKLHTLMKIFQSFRISSQFLCLIFVEKIITAEVIKRLLGKICNLCHLLSSLKGGCTSADAPSPEDNLLFTTDVAVEGLDVRDCSSVIRFDLPKTVITYAQSRGRARKDDSEYVLMIERGNDMQIDMIFDIIRRSHLITTTAPESAIGAGTTKRKELHGTTAISALSGTWVNQNNIVTLQGYKIVFTCSEIDKNYASFVLLIDSVLDEDVSSTEMDLYLIDKMAKGFIRPCGPVRLDTEQVRQAKLFQEFFFNGLFGKLYVGSKSSGVPRRFILQEDNGLPWIDSYMYLLLPLKPSCKEHDEGIAIHWESIAGTTSSVEIVRSCCIPGVGFSCPESHLRETEISNVDMIHLANESVQSLSVKHMVVFAVHTGRIYSVLEIAEGLTSDSPFDGLTSGKSSKFPSFLEYFYKKYGIVLRHPQQPLFLLKQSHNAHNLLSSKSTVGGDFCPKKPLFRAHMPPELLIRINVPLDVVRSFYLLPSLMYRLESLMLASQLRSENFFMPKSSTIPSSSILEAITTMRCCEDFSLERLELLGDSVLKYAISCYLYLKFPKENEGELASRRTSIICNAALHNAGTRRNIQHYIRDAPFDPQRWVAPGQISLKPSPCECGDTSEVSIRAIVEEDKNIVLGKACDGGHRWICSKTISDCVEALIGSYFVGGGLSAACSFLKWLGIGAEIDMKMIEESISTASIRSYQPNIDDIALLESKLGYKFSTKGLILEAVIHGSYHHDLEIPYNYERLEFLGDSALDLLITWHLFTSHRDIDPGDLTDLRSATVSNENFAQVAVRHKFQEHLKLSCGRLSEQIKGFVQDMEGTCNAKSSLHKRPKVLGDLFESIAGAVLVDMKFNISKAWDIFKPLLSPIVTPDTLELPPLRALMERCCDLGYFLNTKCFNKGENIVAELEIQLEDALLVRRGCDKSKKTAKAQAALLLLKDIEVKFLEVHQRPPKRRKLEDGSDDLEIRVDASEQFTVDVNISSTPSQDLESTDPKQIDNLELRQPVKMDKGGPRNALYAICKTLQWPIPKFESEEDMTSSQRKPEGSKKSKGKPACFVSTVLVHVPNLGKIQQKGERRPDKKTAQDSAAMDLLFELQRRGLCRLDHI